MRKVSYEGSGVEIAGRQIRIGMCRIERMELRGSGESRDICIEARRGSLFTDVVSI